MKLKTDRGFTEAFKTDNESMVHTHEILFLTKGNRNSARRLMELENTTASEVTQAQKGKHHTFT